VHSADPSGSPGDHRGQPNPRWLELPDAAGADELDLPEFGLTCLVKDIYQDTPLG
jgi:hypothetical protein